MMAGDISYNSDTRVLTITGDAFRDVAEVRFEGTEVTVDLTATEEDGDGTDDHDQTEDIADVDRIVFNGLAGDDQLTVFVDQAAAALMSDVVLEFNGGSNNDTLIQNGGGLTTTAFGGIGNDTLEGSRFNDILDGGGNDDTYVFRGRNVGSDEIREAANVGTDKLDFTNFDTFVSVDLERVFTPTNQQFAATAFQSNLQLKLQNSTAIENVVGTAFTDTIRGNARANHLMGLGDNDRFEGRGGSDILEGGAGNDRYEFNGNTQLGTDEVREAANADVDTLDFNGMSTGLTIDIANAGNALAVNSTNLRLRLANNTAIENVTGTQFRDTIRGNSRNNRLRGLGERDTIDGRGGADTLEGGEGIDTFTTDLNDEVFGGTGRDIFDTLVENTGPSPRARYRDWGLL
jgi:Ca2+-binding RTX toxin-like protein